VTRRACIASTSDFEEAYGYSRAVRVDRHVYVSGTTAGTDHAADDVRGQLRDAVRIAEEALSRLGASIKDVVRTVIYITNSADMHDVTEVHREAFGAVRPAATVLVVSALMPTSARVEIELTAYILESS
jgi:enamine deaminase RidA (YjgF/YER057c/UK114 family)